MLVIAGAEDPTVAMFGGKVAAAGMQAEWSQSEVDVVMIDGAGHWVHQEEPEEVNRRLLAFFSTHGGESVGQRDEASGMAVDS